MRPLHLELDRFLDDIVILISRGRGSAGSVLSVLRTSASDPWGFAIYAYSNRWLRIFVACKISEEN